MKKKLCQLPITFIRLMKVSFDNFKYILVIINVNESIIHNAEIQFENKCQKVDY